MIEIALFLAGLALGSGVAAAFARRDWRSRAPCPHEHCRHRLPAPGLRRGGVYVGESCVVCSNAVKWNAREDRYERIPEDEVGR
jgi:hypothetical protein